MSTVNFLTSRRSNLAAFNTVQLNVSTLTGSTIQTSATATTSSIVVSTLQTQSGSYSTLSGSTLSASTLSASTLSASIITTNSLALSTLTTTSNVGVGTSAPLAVLDVNGSMRVLDKTYTALTSGTGVDIIYSGGGTLTSGTRAAGGALTAAAMSYAASGHTWYVGSSAGTNAMTVASSGRLGVGTATPRRVVDIVGPPTNPFTYAPTQLSVSDTTGSALMNLLIGVDGTSNYASIQSSQSGVGGRPLLLNASEGNVGVGTTNPAYPLDVYGGSTVLARLKHSADYARFVLEGPSGGDLIFKVAGSSKWGVACIDNHLQFLLNDSTSTIPVVFTSSGSVGIGITNPFSKLNIAGGNIQLGSLAEYENGTTCTEVIQFGGGYAANWTYGYAGIQGGCAGGGGGGGYGGILNFWTKVNNGSSYVGMTLNQGNVAIGTTDPQNNKLRVFGGNSTSGISLGDYQTTAGVKYIGITNSADGTNVGYSSGFSGMTLGAPSDGLTEGYVAFHTHDYGINSDERMRINKSGYVGIGLTNPSYLLHVAGSLNCSSLYVGGVSITSLGAKWTESGSNAYYTTGSIGIGTTSPSNLLTVAQLGANYSAPVLVLDAGIAANASAGAPRGIGAPLLGIGNSSWTSGGAAGDYYGIGFGYGGATSGSYYPAEIGLYVQTTSGSTWGDLVFSTRSTTANNVASERVRITGAGNVGIGITNPAYPLSLVGAQSINGTSSQYSKTASSGNLLFNTSSDSYAYPTMNLFNYDHNNNGIFFDIIYTNPNWQNCTTGTNWGIYKTGGLLQFSYLTGTVGTTGDLAYAMVLTSSGVGIGTTNPSVKLHVNGATFIQGPTVSTTTTNVVGNFGLRISQLTSAQETVGQIVGQMCFHGWGRPYASSFIRCITDATNGYDDAGALVFGTSNSGTGAVETMRISETGYVGIGKTNPAYLLDVAGSFNCTGLYVNGAAFTGGSGATWTVSGSNAYYSTGNIGIGTASPGSALTIYAGGSAQYIRSNSSTITSCYTEWRDYSASGRFIIGCDGPGLADFEQGAGIIGTWASNSIIFLTNATERVRITGAGNIGIGTATPATILHINNTTANAFLIENTSSTSYASMYFKNNTPVSAFMGMGGSAVGGNFQNNFYVQSPTAIVLHTGGNNSTGSVGMLINSSGYVGIGTTLPTNPLTVVGSATIQGQLFAVGGNVNTYYPVLIDAGPSWTTSNTYKFTVSRSSVHMDASWKGATTIIVEGHNYSWGNGADFMKYKIIGSTSGPVSWGNFVANIFEDPNSAFIIIYLRGGTTYYFTGEGCLLNNANASGATLTVPAGSYNASYAATTTVTAPFGSLVASGDYRDNIWSVGGNVGIGKSNPTQLLDVNGAINCTSFLVNGTAVATGTGSVWGVSGSTAYYTSGLVGIGTTNPLTTNQIGDYGGNGMDVWSTTAFDAWAKVRILCNASQFGRTTLEMIGRFEGNNDGWTLNGGRNNIVFGYQTSQGSAITYVNAIQSYNGQLGFFSSGYSSATPAMVLNASGNVGIGTASPAVRLHVFGNSTAGYLNRIQIEGNTSDVACLNLKTAANTSYIFTDGNGHLQLYPNTAASQYVFIQPDPSGKVAIGNNGNTPYGMLQVGHANTASGSSDGNIVFGKSTGSGYRYFKMGYDADFNFSIGDYGHAAGLVWVNQFKINYAAPANCIVVASSGNVGIGTTSMSASLHVYGTGINSSGQNAPMCITHSSNGKRWDVGPNSSSGDFIIFYNNAGVWLNHLSPSGGWNYQSDLRLKDDIAVIPNCMDTIDALRPVSYRMKSNMDSQYKTFGLIAQEVKEVLPELVNSIHDAEHGEIYGITYNGFIPILIGAVKELSAENATLHGTCDTLKAENAAMKSQMASLIAWAQTQGFSG